MLSVLGSQDKLTPGQFNSHEINFPQNQHFYTTIICASTIGIIIHYSNYPGQHIIYTMAVTQAKAVSKPTVSSEK